MEGLNNGLVLIEGEGFPLNFIRRTSFQLNTKLLYDAANRHFWLLTTAMLSPLKTVSQSLNYAVHEAIYIGIDVSASLLASCAVSKKIVKKEG